MRRSGYRQMTRSFTRSQDNGASRPAADYGRNGTLPICTTTDLSGSNSVDLGSKVVSAERAVAAIQAGSRVYIGTGCAAPRSLLAWLEAMEPGPADLEFVSFLTTSALPQVGGSPQT